MGRRSGNCIGVAAAHIVAVVVVVHIVAAVVVVHIVAAHIVGMVQSVAGSGCKKRSHYDCSNCWDHNPTRHQTHWIRCMVHCYRGKDLQSRNRTHHHNGDEKAQRGSAMVRTGNAMDPRNDVDLRSDGDGDPRSGGADDRPLAGRPRAYAGGSVCYKTPV